MSVFGFSKIEHSGRVYLGLNLNEYCVMDFIFKSQSNEAYSDGGWCRHSYGDIATLLGFSKPSVYSIFKRMEKRELCEMMGNGLKRTTVKFYEVAYMNAEKIKALKSFENQTASFENQTASFENQTAVVCISNGNRLKIKQPTKLNLNLIKNLKETEGETHQNDLGEISLNENKNTPPQVAPAPPKNYLELEKALLAHFAVNEGERQMMIGRALFRGSVEVEIMKFCEYHHENQNLLRKPIRNIIPQLTSWLRKSAQFQRNDQRNNSGKKRTKNNLISENELWELDAQLESEGY